MRRPIVIEDPDEREREEEEERVPDQDERWEAEDRAGLGPWGAWAHRVAQRERARRARDDHDGELREPRGLRAAREPRRPDRRPADDELTPAGHVASTVRALHAPGAAALRQQAHGPGLVEATAVTRGRADGPRPHRSGEPEQFSPLWRPHLQALAGATRAAGQECWCSVLPRSEPVHRGKAVAAVGRRRPPGTLWRAQALRRRTRPVARRPAGPRTQPTRAGTSTSSPRAGCRAAELETANARLATLLGGDRVGDRGTAHAPARNPQPQGWTARALVPRGGLRPARCRARRRVGRGPTARRTLRSPRHRRASATTDRGPPGWTSSLRARGSRSSSPTGRSASTDTRGARCTTTTSPRSSSTTSRSDGWYCWACARGGDVIEYAAWRWMTVEPRPRCINLPRAHPPAA